MAERRVQESEREDHEGTAEGVAGGMTSWEKLVSKSRFHSAAMEPAIRRFTNTLATLLDRSARAEPARCAALADTETATVGLDETTGRGNVNKFSGRQVSLRESSLGHRVASSGGRSVLVKRRTPGNQTMGERSCGGGIAGCISGRYSLDHNRRRNGRSQRVADQ
jgi:hypothetical protein